MSGLLPVLAGFTGLEALVVGEAVLDGWLSGPPTRLSREAPVPVVEIDSTVYAPGGAANTAVNLAALGARVRLLSVVGGDQDGATLRAELGARQLDTDDVLALAGRRTLAKRRVLAGAQMLARYDEGHTDALPMAAEDALLGALARRWDAADVVVVSDYGCGVLSDRAVGVVAALQADRPRLLVVDSRHPLRWRSAQPTAVKPNWDEVRELLSPLTQGPRAAAVEHGGGALLDALGAQVVAVTLDTDGAVLLERGRPSYRLFSRPVPHSRAAGAGDSFTAALALALAAGADLPTAGELASVTASVVVAKEGTATASAAEVRHAVATAERQVLDLPALRESVALHRHHGRRLVFTNGCFDVLHRGHVTYLNQAKAAGDVLVVGLNSDASVRRVKGDGRPVNPVEDRAAVLAALSSVDHLVVFDGDTAVDVLEVVRPDVYVKGGDYTAEMLPEAPLVRRLGGEVRILPYLEDRSTTGLLARIRGQQARA